METVQVKYPAEPATSGSEGCGQGVDYQGKLYFYRTGKDIPKNKVAMLTWEGFYCGNMNGEKEWIIVAWNGKDFTVLEYVFSNVREEMKKYKGKTPEECIALRTAIVEHDEKKHKEWVASLTPCRICGKGVLVLEDDQADDECYDCHRGMV